MRRMAARISLATVRMGRFWGRFRRSPVGFRHSGHLRNVGCHSYVSDGGDAVILDEDFVLPVDNE